MYKEYSRLLIFLLLLHFGELSRDAVKGQYIAVGGLDLVKLALEAILHAQLFKGLACVVGLCA